jgi:hypothetical protein
MAQAASSHFKISAFRQVSGNLACSIENKIQVEWDMVQVGALKSDTDPNVTATLFVQARDHEKITKSWFIDTGRFDHPDHNGLLINTLERLVLRGPNGKGPVGTIIYHCPKTHREALFMFKEDTEPLEPGKGECIPEPLPTPLLGHPPQQDQLRFYARELVKEHLTVVIEPLGGAIVHRKFSVTTNNKATLMMYETFECTQGRRTPVNIALYAQIAKDVSRATVDVIINKEFVAWLNDTLAAAGSGAELPYKNVLWKFQLIDSGVHQGYQPKHTVQLNDDSSSSSSVNSSRRSSQSSSHRPTKKQKPGSQSKSPSPSGSQSHSKPGPQHPASSGSQPGSQAGPSSSSHLPQHSGSQRSAGSSSQSESRAPQDKSHSSLKSGSLGGLFKKHHEK